MRRVNKKQRGKRVLALTMASAMLISAAPVGVLAEGESNDNINVVLTTDNGGGYI